MRKVLFLPTSIKKDSGGLNRVRVRNFFIVVHTVINARDTVALTLVPPFVYRTKVNGDVVVISWRRN